MLVSNLTMHPLKRTLVIAVLLGFGSALLPAVQGEPRPAPRPTGGPDWVTTAKPPATTNPPFTLSSSAFKDGGSYPVVFTGDGEGVTPPLSWSNAPKGTQGYALIMHHLDPGGTTKIYWVMYDIPATVTSVSQGATDFGKMGLSTVHGQVEYAPPHSKGPGTKKYVLTLFALSAKPDLSTAPQPVTAETLLAAIKGKVLAAADLTVTYTRNGAAADETARPERRRRPEAPPAGDR